MEYFAGLDVSLETVNVCVVDEDGNILLERKVDAEPDTIVTVLRSFGQPFKRIGLEAGPTSSWLYSELHAAGYPAICLECRHVKAGLSAMRNKTDRNDARGIANLVRLGWFRQVFVKSEEAQRVRMLLVNREQLMNKLQDIENSVRGSLKVFGYRIGRVTKRTFEARVLELIEETPSLLAITEPMLRVRRTLLEEFARTRPPRTAGGSERYGLPAADDGSRCGGGGRAHLQDWHRRTRALLAIAECRCPLRADATAVQLRSDRLRRAHKPVRRRDGSHRPVSGRARPAASRTLVVPTRLGDADREKKQCEGGQSRPRTQALGHHASDVGRRDRLPLVGRQAGGGSSSLVGRSTTHPKPPSRRLQAPGGREEWTSPHRWLRQIGLFDRLRGRARPSVLLNPSCPPVSSNAEHAKKHEPFWPLRPIEEPGKRS